MPTTTPTKNTLSPNEARESSHAMTTETDAVYDLAQTLKTLNLTQWEYDRIEEHMGRPPNLTELSMFSVLWSEHCCYKNSRHLLKKLPQTGKYVLQGPGENAGVVDIGDNIQIAFKIESHNHPTAVEPYQGAATGVGGILRDIFTMNARPVANLNALRFGPLKNSPHETRNRYLFSQAVKGIGHYGNCVGVPTIGGEIFFDETYSGNPLVNAMAIGVIYDNTIMASGAVGVGNPILYVGSATGKDGMGGAAFASRELDEKSQDDRPAVQVGDPFSEKLLIEACLEAFKLGAIVSAQDMGAAGLTSSSCEMASKGNVGMRMDLDKVPAREPDMEAFEYMLSESQERMLMVVEKGREQDVIDVFAKWKLPAVIIGEVIAEENIEIIRHGKKVVSIPAKLLTDLAPNYEREQVPGEPEAVKAKRTSNPTDQLKDLTLAQVPEKLAQLLGSHNIARPHAVFEQYDRHVQNNTLITSDHQASGVIRIRNKAGDFSGKAIAATTDCNSRYIYLDPNTGTQSAVAEAVRNLACVGATPIAVTDNLNFGNPEKDNIYYQMFQSVDGMREACLAFETPVISGNVSLYNEHSGQAILPAPVIGMVGLIDDDSKICSPELKAAGHKVALLGRFNPTLGGSEYLHQATGDLAGQPPDVDLKAEAETAKLLRSLIHQGLLQSAQDVSLGGLLTTLTEVTFPNSLGIELTLDALTDDKRLDAVLFGETNGSYIISYDSSNEAAIQDACQALNNNQLNIIPLGTVLNDAVLKINQTNVATEVVLEPLQKHWGESLAL